MSNRSADIPFPTVLNSRETLLWPGPIGFNFISLPATTFMIFGLAIYAFWATWGTHHVGEFCTNAGRRVILSAREKASVLQIIRTLRKATP